MLKTMEEAATGPYSEMPNFYRKIDYDFTREICNLG